MTGVALLVAEVMALAVGAIWIGIELRRQERRSFQRVDQAITSHLLAPALELEVPFTQRVLQPLLRQCLRFIGRISPGQNLGKLRRQLLIAGSPYGLGALDFIGLRVLVAVGGTLGLTTLLVWRSVPPVRAILAGIGGAILFAELPSFWLHRRMSKRRKAITLALPDGLDMLTVCVDAGLGLESAFQRIGETWNHALAYEFRRAVVEMGMGISWREAMRNMVYRTDVRDLSSLVAVLLQAEQLGFSISDTLHAQADQLRVRRRQRAQEQARAAPLKMLFPMVFFIMPATFAVVLGPAVPAIMEVLVMP